MKLKTIFKLEYWEKHPKKAFYVMSMILVLCIVISTSVSVIQITNNRKQGVNGFTQELKDGFSVIKDDFSQGSIHYDHYRQCKKLESQIDSLLSKEKLSLADSIQMEKIFEELEILYKDLNNE
ncbi:hypothetical protein [Draconibacterium sediminis]|uniref:hypothetical protein n=1 Tax=Draconibacterium sediminis TaxID=1544798 RepID=UPI0026F2EA65|nr:hypothetical protein [Draconibacterium sediminis]